MKKRARGIRHKWAIVRWIGLYYSIPLVFLFYMYNTLHVSVTLWKWFSDIGRWFRSWPNMYNIKGIHCCRWIVWRLKFYWLDTFYTNQEINIMRNRSIHFHFLTWPQKWNCGFWKNHILSPWIHIKR